MAAQPKAMLSCPADAMHGFLDHVRRTWGSAEGYLEAIGVSAATLAAVRAALLEAP